MRILVCGGRDYQDVNRIASVLSEYSDKDVTIIHGGARGADTLAGEWAMRFAKDVVVFKADWDKYGKAAGAIRNQQMLDEGKPDMVIAFPGGRGTADMVRRAKNTNIPTHVY